MFRKTIVNTIRMTIEDVQSIVKSIVAEADQLTRKFLIQGAPVNYACIFSQSEEEYAMLINVAKQMGAVVQETHMGPVFRIDSLPTAAGMLQLLKIRKHDPTRPERGDADFTLSNYDALKKTHLNQDGFKLIDKGGWEMIELMDPGFNVRAYFSNPPLDQQLGIS